MAEYYGILDGAGTAWGVRVPDLPGVHGAGATAALAREDAISAAREWAERQAARGNPLPHPSALGDLLGAEVQPNEVIVSVPVFVDRGRPVRANLSLDAGLLDDIDRAAAQRGLTRSGFIASAVREKILADK